MILLAIVALYATFCIAMGFLLWWGERKSIKTMTDVLAQQQAEAEAADLDAEWERMNRNGPPEDI